MAAFFAVIYYAGLRAPQRTTSRSRRWWRTKRPAGGGTGRRLGELHPDPPFPFPRVRHWPGGRVFAGVQIGELASITYARREPSAVATYSPQPSAMTKLEVRGRAQLAVIAYQAGIVRTVSDHGLRQRESTAVQKGKYTADRRCLSASRRNS